MLIEFLYCFPEIVTVISPPILIRKTVAPLSKHSNVVSLVLVGIDKDEE